MFATLISTLENRPGLRILGPSGCVSWLRIATLIKTLVETSVSESCYGFDPKSQPWSQPEGPKIRNPGGFSMVAIRVANRVSIAIRNPETFWNESGLRPGFRSGLNRNPETTMFRFFLKSKPWAFSMVSTMVFVSIETILKYSLSLA